RGLSGQDAGASGLPARAERIARGPVLAAAVRARATVTIVTRGAVATLTTRRAVTTLAARATVATALATRATATAVAALAARRPVAVATLAARRARGAILAITTVQAALWAALAGVLARLQQGPAREVDPALAVDLGDQDLDLVADVDDILDSRDAVV